MSDRYPKPKFYEIWETPPYRKCSERNPCVAGTFRTEEEAKAFGDRYGFSGEGYIIKEV